MRHILNFLITAFMIWVFQQIGWIDVGKDLTAFDSPFANQLLVSGVIGLIFTIGVWIASQVFGLFALATLGFGCLLFPLYLALLGPAGFWLVDKVLPGWVTITASNVQIIMMGLAVSLIRIPEVSVSTERN